jgi:hypothetical protein
VRFPLPLEHGLCAPARQLAVVQPSVQLGPLLFEICNLAVQIRALL